jgi:hypothetical protein
MSHTCGRRSGKERLDTEWRARAASHHAVITRQEMREIGLSDRQIDHRIQLGQLLRFKPGVFLVGGSAETWEQTALAWLRWAGPGSALRSRSAAALWEMDGFTRDKIQIACPRSLHSPGISASKIVLPKAEIRVIRSVAVTSIERTLLDLAASLHPMRVENALDWALRRRLTAVPRLERYTSARCGKGVRGSRILRELVEVRDERRAPHESALETRLASLIRRGNLATPRSSV